MRSLQRIALQAGHMRSKSRMRMILKRSMQRNMRSKQRNRLIVNDYHLQYRTRSTWNTRAHASDIVVVFTQQNPKSVA